MTGVAFVAAAAVHVHSQEELWVGAVRTRPPRMTTTATEILHLKQYKTSPRSLKRVLAAVLCAMSTARGRCDARVATAACRAFGVAGVLEYWSTGVRVNHHEQARTTLLQPSASKIGDVHYTNYVHRTYIDVFTNVVYVDVFQRGYSLLV